MQSSQNSRVLHRTHIPLILGLMILALVGPGMGKEAAPIVQAQAAHLSRPTGPVALQGIAPRKYRKIIEAQQTADLQLPLAA